MTDREETDSVADDFREFAVRHAQRVEELEDRVEELEAELTRLKLKQSTRATPGGTKKGHAKYITAKHIAYQQRQKNDPKVAVTASTVRTLAERDEIDLARGTVHDAFDELASQRYEFRVGETPDGKETRLETLGVVDDLVIDALADASLAE
jgi:hypothetical protein